MKRILSRPSVHVVIWVGLAVYLTVLDPLYTRLFLRIGKPVTVRFIDEPETPMDQAIDGLSRVKHEGQEVYLLTGWAIPRGGGSPAEEYAKQVVLLDKESKGYVFQAQTAEREDVAEAFNGEAPGAIRSGFSVYISRLVLPVGWYRLAVLYSSAESPPAFGLTDMCIVRTPNMLSLTGVCSPLNGTTDNLLQKLRLLAGLQPDFEMVYAFDELQSLKLSPGTVFQLSGWAFPRDGSLSLQDSRKHIVLLDEHSVPHLLDADTTSRPDVRRSYPDLGSTVEFSGFNARLTTSMLPPGFYRLGLLYTDSDASAYHLTNTSLLHTGTSFELVKSNYPLDATAEDWIQKARILSGLQAKAEMAFGFGNLRSISQGADSVYAIDGWAFPWDGSLSLEDSQKRIVLVDEHSVPHILHARSTSRPDVSLTYPELGPGLESSGFAARLSTSMLQPGLYRLGLLYTDPAGPSAYYLTDTSLLRTPTGLELVPSNSFLDATPDDWYQKVKLLSGLQAESEMAYGFGQLQTISQGTDIFYQLDGWAFPWDNSLPLENVQKRIVLVDDHSVPHLLHAQSTARPDVSQSYPDLEPNVELSGFSARLSASVLQPGLYRLGILYTDSDASAYYMTDASLLRTSTSVELVQSPSPLDRTLDDWLHGVRLRIGLLPESEMTYGFDPLEGITQTTGTIYRLSGWAFPQDGSLPLEECRKRVVLREDGSTPHLLHVQSGRRADIQLIYANLSRDVSFSGFSGYLSPSMLTPGNYRVGLLFSCRGSSPAFRMTDRCVQWSSDALRLSECVPGSESRP